MQCHYIVVTGVGFWRFFAAMCNFGCGFFNSTPRRQSRLLPLTGGANAVSGDKVWFFSPPLPREGGARRAADASVGS